MQVCDRITFDPLIMGGRTCIRGMRIPVSVIVGQIAHGASFKGCIARRMVKSLLRQSRRTGWF